MDRPLGVSILSVYSWIIGILAAIEGAVVIVVAPGAPYLAAPPAVIVAIGIFTVILGLSQVAFGYGAWGLRPWAWPFGLVLFVSSIPLGVSTWLASTDPSPVVSLVLTALVIYYLCQSRIRRLFAPAGAADEAEPGDPDSGAWPDGPHPWLSHS